MGIFALRLHEHQDIRCGSVITTFSGSKDVPSCEPSQKGWLAL
jgi:hypothetical protein